MPRLRLETQDRDNNHESGLNEWSENMITMPEHLASISAFGPGRNVVRARRAGWGPQARGAGA